MECIWSGFGCLPDAAKYIREEVFIREQGFQNELDDIDQRSYHVLLRHDGKDIGTARIFSDDGNQTIHIGRVAVLKQERGGKGKLLLDACRQKARELGAKRLILGAQCRVIKFYEQNGFHAFGERYDEEGCPHQMMEKLV